MWPAIKVVGACCLVTPATRLVAPRFMARALQAVMNVLVVVNGAVHDNEAANNAIRLADALAWVHPLPSDGPLTLVASWLEHGVPREPRCTRQGSPGGRSEISGSALSRHQTGQPDDPATRWAGPLRNGHSAGFQRIGRPPRPGRPAWPAASASASCRAPVASARRSAQARMSLAYGSASISPAKTRTTVIVSPKPTAVDPLA